MGWTRELTELENELCRSLGEVVVFWNHIEQSFKMLLHRATHLGGPDGRLWSLITHLSPVQLRDALIAISEDHEPVRAEHLRHCARVFDREREYRNHYVHGPLTFRTTDSESSGVISNMAARGGSLRVQHGSVTAEELREYLNRLGALQSYIGELIQDSINLRGGKSLDDLSKPEIAPQLQVPKESWWNLQKIHLGQTSDQKTPQSTANQEGKE